MTRVTAIRFLPKVSFHCPTTAVNSKMAAWKRGYNLEKKKVLRVARGGKVIWKLENGEKKAGVYREFDVVKSTI